MEKLNYYIINFEISHMHYIEFWMYRIEIEY